MLEVSPKNRNISASELLCPATRQLDAEPTSTQMSPQAQPAHCSIPVRVSNRNAPEQMRRFGEGKRMEMDGKATVFFDKLVILSILTLQSISPIAWGCSFYRLTGAVGFTADGLGGVCPGVSAVSRWCLCGGVVVVSRRCLGSLTVASGRCLHGVVLFWWWVRAFMVSRWCLGGVSAVSMLIQGVCNVLVVSWWRHVGGVEAVVLAVGCVLVAFPCVSLKAWVCFLGWSHHASSLTVLSCCHADDHDCWRWQWTWWWGWGWWWWWSWWYTKTTANIPWCHVAM